MSDDAGAPGHAGQQLPLEVPERIIELSRPGVIWLGGEAVTLEYSGGEKAVARLTGDFDESATFQNVVAAGFGSVPAPFPRPTVGTLTVGGRNQKEVRGAIDRWYRREARNRIGRCLEVESERLDLHASKVTIRDQKTRWGSCSTSGTLSFNWRLVIGPHHALRYVVIHELIHIRHHNHSKAFWADLTAALPDWRESAKWLRANEGRLTRYKPRLK